MSIIGVDAQMRMERFNKLELERLESIRREVILPQELAKAPPIMEQGKYEFRKHEELPTASIWSPETGYKVSEEGGPFSASFVW
jgi:hypothetical protein